MKRFGVIPHQALQRVHVRLGPNVGFGLTRGAGICGNHDENYFSFGLNVVVHRLSPYALGAWVEQQTKYGEEKDEKKNLTTFPRSL